ncbi:MAG: hypothetical protein ACK4M9_18295 [Anaerobacillus sp.]|uniref:hypothetical protein n=1 Tax=Anaerobacillus sp. TaxID=1872506 RepID=UPI00391B7023
MQPLTTKEMEYIVDSMSNEDLLIKQCIATMSQTQNPAVKNLCQQSLATHQQHYNQLLQSLQQHLTVAPMNQQQMQ